MKDELKAIYDTGNDIFGHPQVYKTISFYPIKLKDVKYQKLFYQIFAHPKSYIANRDILRASYLKFYLYVIQPNLGIVEDNIMNDLETMIKYLTHCEKVIFTYIETGIPGFESIKIKMTIDGVDFTEIEFDNIREIVLQQNGLSIEYIEEYNPQLEETLSFVNRHSSIEFEDEIFTYSVLMKVPLSDIEEYSLYQFRMSFEKLLTLKEYDLYKPLVVSGQITLKEGEIKHYLYHSAKTGRYDSIKIELSDEWKKKTEESFKAN